MALYKHKKNYLAL